MNYLLFNAFADGGKGEESAKEALKILQEKIGETTLKALVGLDVKSFLKELKKDDKAIILGGDGTLNHFINELGEEQLPCSFYLYPSGTGNDFLNDVKDKEDPETHLVELNGFITNLPYVEVKGKTYRFINGIGFGIDGECCVEAERKKKEGETEIDYAKITIGLLLGRFKAPLSTVKVDGEELQFKKTYIAAAMNGRFYGGGMNVAPEQERGSGLLSLAVIHGRGKIGTLMLFPKLFKGTHVKSKKAVYIKKGKEIEVTFSLPTALQIDGEVVEGVTTYKAYIK